MTHYIPFFTQTRPGPVQRAACDAYVVPSDHSAEPTCSRCQEWIDDLATSEDEAAADLAPMQTKGAA